ncbi:hypothetical protein BJP34_23170 [Moorena producens PAL-8-15-08-1]|uniref:Microcyclamide/patellamide family RiPP n=1 Tax=Moorena producens PAL-8-15-08-1 TaxID=1458985 RepID=A0A1D8TWJ0_9CYAN|nr:hypothetical protein BJP34_23170 [Moorena producens PAL-8-15-08-1]
MGKKKLLPGQKSPIVRSTTAKPIPGLEETALTEGYYGSNGLGVSPSSCACEVGYCIPFAGDDAE